MYYFQVVFTLCVLSYRKIILFIRVLVKHIFSCHQRISGKEFYPLTCNLDSFLLDTHALTGVVLSKFKLRLSCIFLRYRVIQTMWYWVLYTVWADFLSLIFLLHQSTNGRYRKLLSSPPLQVGSSRYIKAYFSIPIPSFLLS